MSEDSGKLQRIEHLELQLPPTFDKLSSEDQLEIIRDVTKNDLEMRKELLQKVNQSNVAEHDMDVVGKQIARLDHDRKYYSIHQKVETGSGAVEINVKGGDTKFITPILIVIAVVILGLALIVMSG